MCWGFDWRRPQPIHARSETISIKEPFRTPFNAGQRGIVLLRTFNEREAVVKPSGKTETRQWTIEPQDGRPRPFCLCVEGLQDRGSVRAAAVLRDGDGAGQQPHRRTIKPLEAKPRRPAILEDEGKGDSVWATWLDEDGAPPDARKALLKTMEGVNWTAVPERKKPSG